jgi:uncharacterized protein YggT (Ycf19 family)
MKTYLQTFMTFSFYVFICFIIVCNLYVFLYESFSSTVPTYILSREGVTLDGVFDPILHLLTTLLPSKNYTR